MQRMPAIDSARNFLAVVWDGSAPNEATLSAALDRLLASYHDAPETSATASKEHAPRQDYSDLYRQTAIRFPEYGKYPIADPTAPFENALMMGDAIDDLVDLTLDMREVVWLHENIGYDEAMFFFRLLFSHWGLHARGLLGYLHARQFG